MKLFYRVALALLEHPEGRKMVAGGLRIAADALTAADRPPCPHCAELELELGEAKVPVTVPGLYLVEFHHPRCPVANRESER